MKLVKPNWVSHDGAYMIVVIVYILFFLRLHILLNDQTVYILIYICFFKYIYMFLKSFIR